MLGLASGIPIIVLWIVGRLFGFVRAQFVGPRPSRRVFPILSVVYVQRHDRLMAAYAIAVLSSKLFVQPVWILSSVQLSTLQFHVLREVQPTLQNRIHEHFNLCNPFTQLLSADARKPKFVSAKTEFLKFGWYFLCHFPPSTDSLFGENYFYKVRKSAIRKRCAQGFLPSIFLKVLARENTQSYVLS